MKNQVVRFTCATPATLAISLVKLKDGKDSIRVRARMQTPGAGRKGKVKTETGCLRIFPAGQTEEASNLVATLIADAKEGGWVMTERSQRTPAFTSIPKAPTSAPAAPPAVAPAPAKAPAGPATSSAPAASTKPQTVKPAAPALRRVASR